FQESAPERSARNKKGPRHCRGPWTTEPLWRSEPVVHAGAQQVGGGAAAERGRGGDHRNLAGRAEVKIFALHGPVAVERGFEAAAKRPAREVRLARERAEIAGETGNPGFAEGDAAGGIEHPVVEGITDAASRRAEPRHLARAGINYRQRAAAHGSARAAAL